MYSFIEFLKVPSGRLHVVLITSLVCSSEEPKSKIVSACGVSQYRWVRAAAGSAIEVGLGPLILARATEASVWAWI
ncbi:hypothetical protein OWV82_020951 [Melia azedarach]|uniref:Uncharacterized protein n=1 Tax=Melia azedarach TaxID=155640 RepID=A0ACC1X8H6_MELAZ|nr:hypothetical protein OWV82_020951 [Melia azedarach]